MPATAPLGITIDEAPEGFKTSVPSPLEVRKARTKRGGWTRATLAKWGIPWPPPKGWRRALREAWEWEQTYRKHFQ